MTEIVNGIEIREKVYDPYMDLYVIFGLAADPTDEPYIVAWLNNDDQELHIKEEHQSKQKAYEDFQDAVHGETQSEHRIAYDDRKDRVYALEQAYIEKQAQNLARSDAITLIDTVCKDYGIRSPKLIMGRNSAPSEYYTKSHTIRLREHNDMTLLHELAHAIIAEECRDIERETLPHSPQFVWILSELYDRYMDVDTHHFLREAEKQELLGDWHTLSLQKRHAHIMPPEMIVSLDTRHSTPPEHP